MKENNQPSLSAQGITVGYGGEPVLTDLDFAVAPGQFTAVIGPNGCGKSTLVKTLARTLKPTAGQVLLDEKPLPAWRSKAIARRLALLPQHPITPDGVTVRSLVARGRHPYHSALRQWAPGDDEAINTALQATEVADLQDHPVAGLSGGQRQRAWIAMVLAQDTEFVLLDEPTSFLDVAHQVEVLHLCQDIRDAGRTVLTVLHDLNQAARYADRLVVMDAGRIVAVGAPEKVLTESLVHQVFGLHSQIITDPQSSTPMVVPLHRVTES